MAVNYALWFGVVYLVCTVSSAKAMQCKGTAKYTLTFQGEWSQASHPSDFPSSSTPHFSSPVGCSHNASYVMWIPGGNASKGVKDVAERGSITEINKEMDAQITLKRAHKRYSGRSIYPGTGQRVITNIEVTSDYPLVSFITMIAPSPDWFVGVHDFDLCNTTSGEWRDLRERYLPLYDAGTDSGPRFTSSDSETRPPERIFIITNNTEGSLKGDKPLKRFGTFTFVKTFDSNEVVKPSPSNILKPSTESQYQPTKSKYQSNMPVKSSLKITPTTSATRISSTQVLNQTATSNQTSTPTGTSAASSFKEFSFMHAVFALIFADLLL
ncbi:spondin-2-like isoform X2 [Dendronephthya gigantea]|uniref:spondin-2-like isoform X2 n=1 Tax=Dendronephthya gigantea TaxID=151771 RepID=UPI00106B7E3B|nr:spondin-2-like isoform X2 [Dendronephthya gigantea]